MWGELVRTDQQMEGMMYPRMLATAERAWHKASWEEGGDASKRQRMQHADWEAFVNALAIRELERLEKMGVDYYLPPPGVELVHHT